MATGKHWKVASKETKEVAVALTGGPEPHKTSPCSHPLPPGPHPSERTLRRWRSEKRCTGELHDPLPKGHPRPKLSGGEKEVIGGWVLDKFDHHQVVSVESVRSFALSAWDQSLSVGVVPSLMEDLELPSRIVTEKELKYWNPNLFKESLSFLTAVHAAFSQGLPLSKLAAVDVCYWTNSGHIVRSYGPAGEFVLPVCSVRDITSF
jgi:hypothetical protein